MNERIYKLFPFTLALLTILVFLPALRNEFVSWDDPTNFLDNLNYRGLGWTQLHWMWTSHLMNRYIPITWMTLGFDYTIWGMEPFGYHLTSLLFHAANGVIFYWLALALFRRAIPESSAEMRARIPIGAFSAALVFTLHPLRVESVAWITERRDVVSGLFYLLAIWMYVRGVPEAPGRPIERKHYWSSLTLFVLAILSKEIAVTLPAVLLLLDIYPLRRLGGGASARSVLLEKIPFFAISIADSALALYVGYEDNAPAFTHLNGVSRMAVSVYGLAFYFWKTVLPFHLSPMHALTQHRMAISALPFQLSAVVVVWMIAAALVLRRRFPALPVVLAAYTITLLPVLGIFHNGHQITADRYSYLACLGWALLAGAALLQVWTKWGAVARQIGTAIAVVCLGALSVLTWRQTQVWRDSDTLWRYCIANDPSSFAYNNIAVTVAGQGDMLTALEYLRLAVELDPANGQAHSNYGNTLLHVEDWDGAAREFQAAKEILPDLANARWGLGYARMMQGRLDEAIAELQEAVRLNPADPDARSKLAEAQAKKNTR